MNFGLYAIIYRPVLDYSILAETFAEEEIRYVQLREKDKPDRELVAIAKRLRQIFQGSKSLLVINDRPDIAKIVNADALHLGQDDIYIEDAKKIVGDNIRIGLSTHNLDQLKAALVHPVAYVGFGPIFPTTAKKNPDPVVGVNLLKQALEIATVPVVAIGGIFPENIDQVLAAGAKNICTVRYLMQATSKQELRERILFLKQKIKAYDTASTSPSGQNNERNGSRS